MVKEISNMLIEDFSKAEIIDYTLRKHQKIRKEGIQEYYLTILKKYYIEEIGMR